MEHIQAHIATSKDGRTILFYVEPEGNTSILHMITAVQGVGQADLKMTGPCHVIEKAWQFMLDDNFERACIEVASIANQLEPTS